MIGPAHTDIAAMPTGRCHSRILVSVDAVGGVWRYAMDLAAGLARHGYAFTFAGFGPRPSPVQRAEAERLGELVWFDAPLDWTAADETELDCIPALLGDLVSRHAIDLVNLNLPSQACDLRLGVPLVVVSHSCVVTWFAAVRRSKVPPDWQWQYRRNRAGFDMADIVLAPSAAHADMLRASYGQIDNLSVVHNATRPAAGHHPKQAMVFAVGRWWDDGKNGALLDAAAAYSAWPVVMAGPVTGPNGQRFQTSRACSLGELPHGEILHRMGEAAIVASPSIYEPFGLAPLEAAQAGAALVLADIPTYRELWDEAAVFAAPNDPKAFADALNRLACDNALCSEFAMRARQRSARYTLEAQATTMHAVYDRLLHSSMARQARG